MSIQSMPLGKWILLLIASLFLSILLYAFAGIPGMVMSGWSAWIANVVTAVVMLLLYKVFVKWFENEKARDLPANRMAGHTALGMGVGFFYFVVVVGIMMAVSLYKIDGYQLPWARLADAFFNFLIVAIGEEIIFRGVLFRWIDERFGFWWAMIVSGLIFGLVHLTNDNATLLGAIGIALEAGLLLGAAYKWAGTLWLFAVSGNDAGDSIIQATIDGPQWLTGGAFGAEASVISMVVGLAVTAVFVRRIMLSK